MRTWGEMTPKERDALVAEKIMGFQGRKIVYSWTDRAKKERPATIFTAGRESIGDYSTWVDEHGTKIQYGTPHCVYFAPCYTTDIAAAWEILEKMRGNPDLDSFTLGTSAMVGNKIFDGFTAALFIDETMYTGEGFTAPEAICIAALRAVGVDV